MAAPSPVLYALHHTIEPQGFENLCVDLLNREGHSRIVPGGRSRDHGRDAEVRYWTNEKRGSPQIAFQFSMEVRWESKLRKDLDKITRHSDSIERIVFISSRQITVEKQDKLRAEFRKTHQLELEIFDAGWFRVRLEEEHKDLAFKHLGVKMPDTPGFYVARIKLHGLTDENQKEMLRNTSPESLRATLTAQTKADPENSSAWKALADVCYYLHDYDSALSSTLKALKCATDEVERFNITAMKAVIIAEQGIASGSRLHLKKAKGYFLSIVSKLGRAVDYYNLANVLGAMGDWKVAEAHYRRCLEIDPAYAQAWNNLGTVLVKTGRHDEAIECYDRALALRPDLIQALCTKANVLIMATDKVEEALALILRAFELDPDLECRWPHAQYWHAMALCRQDRFPEALAIVEDALERKMECPYLGGLATDIHSKLWRTDESSRDKAEEFFHIRIDSQERDYRVLSEMMDILDVTGREAEAWTMLNEFLSRLAT